MGDMERTTRRDRKVWKGEDMYPYRKQTKATSRPQLKCSFPVFGWTTKGEILIPQHASFRKSGPAPRRRSLLSCLVLDLKLANYLSAKACFGKIYGLCMVGIEKSKKKILQSC